MPFLRDLISGIKKNHHRQAPRKNVLAPFVQRVDDAIHWINLPVDNAKGLPHISPLDSDLSSG